jgi:hypothetical protein
MKFNEKEGAMVSDEQASTYIRKYDIAEKIHEIKTEEGVVLLGGSGASDFLLEAYNSTKATIDHYVKEKQPVSTDDVVQALSNAVSKLRRAYTEAFLRGRFGLSEAELQIGCKMLKDGRAELDREFKQQVANAMSSDQFTTMISNRFTVLTYSPEGTRIYGVDTTYARPVPSSSPYGCVGSGVDMADSELSAFLETMPRDKRHEIDPLEGIAVLLYATDRASRTNVGVGGTPLISVIHKGTVLTPSENSSKLASEIVSAEHLGYLPHEFVKEALEELIYKGTDFREVNKAMGKAAAANGENLVLRLRGYKC